MAKNKKKGSNYKHQWENPEIKNSNVNASTNVNISENTKLIDKLQTILSDQATDKANHKMEMDATLNQLKRIVTSNEETRSKYYDIKKSVTKIASDHVFIVDYTRESSNFLQNFFMVLFLLVLQIASFILLNNSETISNVTGALLLLMYLCVFVYEIRSKKPTVINTITNPFPNPVQESNN